MYSDIRDFELLDGILDRSLCVGRFDMSNGRNKGRAEMENPPPVVGRIGSIKAHLNPPSQSSYRKRPRLGYGVATSIHWLQAPHLDLSFCHAKRKGAPRCVSGLMSFG